ncbi:methyl-accepting chemotaxis protein [Chromohalobacter marismortui]|uniref:Methyl-accepting chemotaxis protein n=1 Tax=Chromohalobacter marismortui TaxID=42055 RepID=A0A4R7NCD4_9GAMM|nr:MULTISPECIES: methyl-accepting chemotaxis protein [Chromohalobacter]MCI0510800.1 methyl-accepting chemotaxis protein [Chromohalobacter sp.]MCI0594803.1 methyl-accepting chemotaxis protein [Chromohalobacter sp.]TDU18053.1 methyl-accepting chemotaxis protein [Chromohalobacter marismortui]
MHFKSIRTLVATLVGICIVVLVVALVGYATFTNSRSAEFVDKQTRELLEQNIKQRLDAVAATQAERIKARLTQALDQARNLASLNELMGQEQGVSLTREELSNVVRDTVAENPDLLDAFIGWEPNAFGDDSNYTGREDAGYGPNGRFMPWWYRTESGDIEVLPLGKTMESETLQDSGIREGEYYLCPRETQKPCVIDPAPYDYNGKTLMVTSFNVPVMVDGEFRGSAGVDLSVDFIQGLLREANGALYDGAGEMALIAPRGGVTAYTGHPQAAGKQAEDVFAEAVQARLERASTGEPVRDASGAMIELYWPFRLMEDSQPWTVMIRLPAEVVMAGADNLQAALEDQRQSNMVGMIVVGAVIAALGLVVSWLLGGSLSRPLRQLAGRMRDIASGGGDLTQRLPVRGRNEIAELATQFNAFADKMNDVLLDVRDSSDSVRVASSEIASASQDLAGRTDTTASSLQETSASMEELTSTVSHTADSASQASGLAESASQSATRGGEVVGDVVKTMDEIETASQQVAEIVTTMDSIAFQTNLLALNASVEAARAGEEGRGFAVVASEVRQLATRSAEAAREIKSLIDNASSKTQSGAELARSAGTAMNEIVEGVTRVTDVLNEISAATSEQRDGIGQVNVAVTDLDNMTQQNAAMVEESATAAAELKAQSQRLAETVGAFTLRERGEGESQPAALPSASRTS